VRIDDAGSAAERRLFEAGLVDPDAEDAPQRVQALELLLRNGATIEQLQASGDWGRLWTLVSDLGREWEPATMSVEEVAEHLGVSRERVRRICLSAGIVAGEDADPLIAPSDIVIFESFEEAASTFGFEPMLSFNRVLGAALASVAEAAHRLFDTELATEVSDAGGRELDLTIALMAAVASEARIPDALARTVRYHLAASQARRRDVHAFARESVTTTVCFVDLVASTELAERHRGRVWSRIVAAFEDAAWDLIVGDGGRVVKLIGDEVMFVHAERATACATAPALVAWVTGDDRLQGARAGLAFGEVQARGGDYFGPVVNLAARTVGQARTNELVATMPVADALRAASGWTIEAIGDVRLKGFDQPVPLARLRRS
jgi:class 3 adenylate cyclase